MKYIKQSNVIILEQNGCLGIMHTHKKFVDYVVEALNSGYFSLTGSLIRNMADTSHIELTNFSVFEDWGRWSLGNKCSITIHDSLLTDKALYLKGKFHAFAQNQEVVVSLNSDIIDTITVTQEDQNYMIELPKEKVQGGDNTISFSLSNKVITPREFNNTNDDRHLGLGFVELSIIEGGKK